MKSKYIEGGEIISTLNRIRMEYSILVSNTSFSIEYLLNSEHFNLTSFCKSFYPHREIGPLQEAIEVFGIANGIWLENSKHHSNCALYVYPTGEPERVLTIMKNWTFGFYLNDQMGRDVFKFLDRDQQEKASQLILNMTSVNFDLKSRIDISNFELTNIEILKEFKAGSPIEWFRRFLKTYNYHLKITHQDGDSKSLGVLSIDEYIFRRCHLAGVHHVVLCVEYSTNNFLDWNMIRKTPIYSKLKRLHLIAAIFGGLSNDFFSFEKEVIDNSSDSNFLTIIALNYPTLPLVEIINKAAGVVRNYLIELNHIIKDINYWKTQSGNELIAPITDNVSGVINCIKATWLWHLQSGRYKRKNSIFIECNK